MSVVTLTLIVPDACAGAIAVIEVVELTVTASAGTPPKDTFVTSLKFVPVMATDVPPPVPPEEVPRLLMVGTEEEGVDTTTSDTPVLE